VPVEGLALARIFYAATALILGVSSFTWISQSPPAFFDPPIYSIAVLWDSFPGYWFLQSLSTGICILFILLFFGYRTRITSLLLTGALILGYSFGYSFGKIDHNILMVVFPGVMAFSGWGEALSVDSVRRDGGSKAVDVASAAWPVALMALLIGFGYFSAGIEKLPWLDLDPTTHGARSWLVRGYFVWERQEFLAPLFVAIDSQYFWEVMDIMAVLFETGFLLSVLHGRIFKAFVAVAVAFHLVNYLMLNISFAGMIRVYALFMPWALILQYRGRLYDEQYWQKLFQKKWMIAGVGLYLPLYWVGQSVLVGGASHSISPFRLAFEYIPYVDFGLISSGLLFGAGVAGVIYALWTVYQAQIAPAGFPERSRARA